MKRFAFGFGVAVVVAGWVAGCHDSVEATASAVCSIECPCEFPTASADAIVSCISSCETSGQVQALAPACSDCIIQNGDSCGTVQATCTAACKTTMTMMPGSGASANIRAACALECDCQFPTGPQASIDSCKTSCETGTINETCATCVNADGTCQAGTTCATQCQ